MKLQKKEAYVNDCAMRGLSRVTVKKNFCFEFATAKILKIIYFEGEIVMSIVKASKKLSAIVLSTIFICSSVSISTYANENTDLLKLADSYGLQDVSVSSLPEGVTPIEITSEDELISYMNDLEEMNVTVLPPISTRATSTRRTAVKLTKATLSLEMYCYAECWNEGSFYEISDYGNKGWRLTGVTAGLEVSDPRVNADIVRGELAVEGTVTIDSYFIVSGIIKLFSNPYEGHYTYSLTDGYSNDEIEMQ